jgi:hypothetical protein
VNDLRIAEHSTCTTPGSLATSIADNYANMFSISGVNNPVKNIVIISFIVFIASAALLLEACRKNDSLAPGASALKFEIPPGFLIQLINSTTILPRNRV